MELTHHTLELVCITDPYNGLSLVIGCQWRPLIGQYLFCFRFPKSQKTGAEYAENILEKSLILLTKSKDLFGTFICTFSYCVPNVDISNFLLVDPLIF